MSSVTTITIAVTTVLVISTMAMSLKWCMLQRRMRMEQRRRALQSFADVAFERCMLRNSALLQYELKNLRDCDKVAKMAARAAQEAAFPRVTSLPVGATREVIVERLTALMSNEAFAIGAGASEQLLRTLFDCFKETGFAHTLAALASESGAGLVASVHDAGVQVVPAVQQTATALRDYYVDHPAEVLRLIAPFVKAHESASTEPLWDLLKHGLQQSHLHIYAESFAPVMHPFADGFSHFAVSAQEHLSNLGAHSFELPASAEPHFHFPLLTLALSAFREVDLLVQQKTTVADSLRNAGLDVAGTAGGALAGAKAGAFIGAAGGPIGMAVLGVLGTVVGSIFGRLASNKVKTLRLKELREAYESTSFRLESETATATRELYEGAGSTVDEAQRRYVEVIREPQSLQKRSVPLGEDVGCIADSFREGLRHCSDELRTSYGIAAGSIPADRWYHYLTGGWGARATMAELKDLYVAKESELRAFAAMIPSLGHCRADPLESLRQLSLLSTPKSPQNAGVTQGVIAKLVAIRNAHAVYVTAWSMDAVLQHKLAVHNMQEEIHGRVLVYKERCATFRNKLRMAAEALQTEMRKHGLA